VSLHATPHPKQQNQMMSYEELFLVLVTPSAIGLKPCHICKEVENKLLSGSQVYQRRLPISHEEPTKKSTLRHGFMKCKGYYQSWSSPPPTPVRTHTQTKLKKKKKKEVNFIEDF
jgi:hypothetical protein